MKKLVVFAVVATATLCLKFTAFAARPLVVGISESFPVANKSAKVMVKSGGQGSGSWVSHCREVSGRSGRGDRVRYISCHRSSIPSRKDALRREGRHIFGVFQEYAITVQPLDRMANAFKMVCAASGKWRL